MKKTIAGIIIGLLLFGSGGWGLWAEKNTNNVGSTGDFDRMIESQIEASQSMPFLLKSINTDGTIETQTLSNKAFDLREELSIATQYSAFNPKLKDYFVFIRKGNTIEAVLKPENTSRTKLDFQWIMLGENNKIRSLHTELRSDTWLYDSQTVTNVVFDETGIYQRHDLSYTLDLFGGWWHYEMKIQARRK
jgi:hypothetical protein